MAIYDRKKKSSFQEIIWSKTIILRSAKKKILFSSQISGILQDKNFNRQLDQVSIQNFFFIFLQAPYSPLKY